MTLRSKVTIGAAAFAVAFLGLAVSMSQPGRLATADAADAAGGDLPAAHRGVATFGSGCFWCTESDFDKVPGVVETTSGYMGGHTENPTYKEVSTGKTGHIEVLQVVFDKRRVDYETLLQRYWRTTDVVDGGGQFCDRGNQYAPVIFGHNERQLQLAQAGKQRLDESGRFDRPVAVTIRKAETFTAAEDYHQNYYKTNAMRYRFYRWNCGRDQRLEELWGEPVTH